VGHLQWTAVYLKGIYLLQSERSRKRLKIRRRSVGTLLIAPSYMKKKRRALARKIGGKSQNWGVGEGPST